MRRRTMMMSRSGSRSRKRKVQCEKEVVEEGKRRNSKKCSVILTSSVTPRLSERSTSISRGQAPKARRPRAPMLQRGGQ